MIFAPVKYPPQSSLSRSVSDLVSHVYPVGGSRQEAIQSLETAISCQTDLNIAHATSQQHQSRAQRDVE